MDLTEDLTKHEELVELFAESGVVLAYLFGSQAEAKAGPTSDVDVAVLLGSEVEPEAWPAIQIDLMGNLMSLLGRDDVDLVILNGAGPVMAQRVAEHGRVLFEAEPGIRAGFEVATLRRYVDTERLRSIQDRALLRRIETYRAAMGDT